eukprot:7730124-Lingulodinium_polyedra.AAC.1
MALGLALALVYGSSQGGTLWFSRWATAHVVLFGRRSWDAWPDDRLGTLLCPAVIFKLDTVVRW